MSILTLVSLFDISFVDQVAPVYEVYPSGVRPGLRGYWGRGYWGRICNLDLRVRVSLNFATPKPAAALKSAQ